MTKEGLDTDMLLRSSLLPVLEAADENMRGNASPSRRHPSKVGMGLFVEKDQLQTICTRHYDVINLLERWKIMGVDVPTLTFGGILGSERKLAAEAIQSYEFAWVAQYENRGDQGQKQGNSLTIIHYLTAPTIENSTCPHLGMVLYIQVWTGKHMSTKDKFAAWTSNRCSPFMRTWFGRSSGVKAPLSTNVSHKVCTQSGSGSCRKCSPGCPPKHSNRLDRRPTQAKGSACRVSEVCAWAVYNLDIICCASPSETKLGA